MDFSSLTAFMKQLTNWRIPGNSISVYYKGVEVYRYSSGFSDLENQLPMTGQEVFNLYSCSKVTAAVAGLQLLEQGKYLLSDPLYEYLPEFKTMFYRDKNGQVRETSRPITVEDLFTMSAGFDYDLESEPILKARQITGNRMDTVAVAKCLAEKILDFEPGDRWQYSLCHDVLAALVEVVSGKKYSQYVKEHIFDPLGMARTGFHRSALLDPQTAAQYEFFEESDRQEDEEGLIPCAGGKGYWKNIGKHVRWYELGPEYDSGGAGMYSCMDDYVKLAVALANNGKTKDGYRILSGRTVRLMKEDQLSPEQKKDYNWEQLRGYGYGLGVRILVSLTEGAIGNIGEFGWDGAAGAIFLADTECNLAYLYCQHLINSHTWYIEPRLRNIVYSCLD